MISYLSFDPQDILNISAPTRVAAYRELGRQMQSSARYCLETKNHEHSTEYLTSMIQRAENLAQGQVCVVEGVNYLRRYLDILYAYSDGAGISREETLSLQIETGINCQTMIVHDDQNNITSFLHTEENFEDNQLVDLHIALAKKGILSLDKLDPNDQESQKLVQEKYKYRIVNIETPDETLAFFVYPGICSGGATFGFHASHNLFIVADSLWIADKPEPYTLWANALAAMIFDCPSITIARQLLQQINSHHIPFCNSYAFHLMSNQSGQPLCSFEVGADNIIEVQPLKKGTISMLWQTNLSRDKGMNAHDIMYTALRKMDVSDKNLDIALSLQSGIQQMSRYIDKVPTTLSLTENTKKLLEISASPEGNMEIVNGQKVHAGFTTIYEAAYFVGSISSQNYECICGKMSPPPMEIPYKKIIE